MDIYIFFKQYYIAIGEGFAKRLAKKGMTPNIASISAIPIIIVLFLSIYYWVDTSYILIITLFLAINAKLVLNAIDGIIARETKIKTTVGMLLNIGTDIVPDMMIFFIIAQKISLSFDYTVWVLILMLLYLIGEFFFIFLHKKQNLFRGKELRTFFYIRILGIIGLGLNPILIPFYYSFIFVLHQYGFFYKK